MKRFVWWSKYIRQDLELFPVPRKVVRARLKDALRIYDVIKSIQINLNQNGI